MAPLVSIVILVKNEIHHLQKSIPIILAQSFQYPFEIIIIDSGSTDGSVQFIKEISCRDKSVSLIELPSDEFHHARTRNYGSRLAKGDLAVFLGGDAIPYDSNWLMDLVSPVLEGESQGVAASYGKQVPRKDIGIGNYCRMTFNYDDNYRVKDKYSTLSRKELYFFSSVNCCINKNLLTYPYFDEKVPVNEDVTLSYKIINNNLKIVYSPLARVLHSHDYSNYEILCRYFDNAVTYTDIGIFEDDVKSINDDKKRFIRFGLANLKNKPLIDWLRFAFFIVSAGIGLKLGQNYNFIPTTISSRLSKYDVVRLLRLQSRRNENKQKNDYVRITEAR
jgi:rhamnosyltransferase